MGGGRTLPQGSTNFRLVMLMGLRIIEWGSLVYTESNHFLATESRLNPGPSLTPALRTDRHLIPPLVCPLTSPTPLGLIMTSDFQLYPDPISLTGD